jgi:protein TonB
MNAEFFEAGGGWRERARWGIAALIVLIAHAAGAWFITRHQPEASMGEMPAAIMIELAQLPVAPAIEPTDLAPGPEVSEVPPEPEPEIDLPPPPEPAEPTFDAAEFQPPPPSAPKPEVVLPDPPKEKPVAKSPKPEVKKPAPRPRQPDDRQRARSKPQNKVATAPPRPQVAAAAPAAPTMGSAVASSASPANWRGALIAHLNRVKRYPSEARRRREEGVVRLNFSIDRNGRVMSYRIAESSGSTALDQEALAMIQRASPLPAPPPNIGGARISLVVPVRFNVN